VLSFNNWADYQLFDRTFFELTDFLTSNIMLPLGGMFIALFAGWVLPRGVSASELDGDNAVYRAWRILVRYVSPTAVFLVFLHLLGVFPA
jgi:NSS family neurotransmitter:Na+ symporter